MFIGTVLNRHGYKMKYIAIFGCLTIYLSGCGTLSPSTTKTIQTGLTDIQLTCIDSSQFTDAQEVKDACNIVDIAIPFIEKLIFYRELAKRAAMYPQ